MEAASAPQVAQGRFALDFFAHMALHGVEPANLYAALRGARQLGKGFFLAAVQTEGLQCGESPVGTKACRKYLPAVAPGPREKVARHLPPCVRADIVFRHYQQGGLDAIIHMRRQFGLSRPHVKFLKSSKCLAVLLLTVHPAEGIQDMYLRLYTTGESPNSLLTEGGNRDLDDCIAGLWEADADLTDGASLDARNEAELGAEFLRNTFERTCKAWFARNAKTPAAPSATAAAASSTQVAAPGQPTESIPPVASPPDLAAAAAAKLNAEVAESNLAARHKKETAKREHKKLQPTLTEARAHEGPPLPGPSLLDHAQQKGGPRCNKPRHPKKAVEKKSPGPSEFELEREMSKLRLLAQQHLATAPPLCIAETSPPAPARRRKAPQGDAKLARRVAAADVLE